MYNISCDMLICSVLPVGGETASSMMMQVVSYIILSSADCSRTVSFTLSSLFCVVTLTRTTHVDPLDPPPPWKTVFLY